MQQEEREVYKKNNCDFKILKNLLWDDAIRILRSNQAKVFRAPQQTTKKPNLWNC